MAGAPWTTRRWAAIVGALAIVWLAIAPGCTCLGDDDDELASIEDPIEAQLVWRTSKRLKFKGGGRLTMPSGTETTYAPVLIVEGFAELTLDPEGWNEDSDVELFADPEGKRLAWKKDDEITVAYLLRKDHIFLSDPTSDELDWDAVPSFEEAAASLFNNGRNWTTCVVSEVGKLDEGTWPAFLVATMAAPEDRNRAKHSRRHWDDLWYALDEPARVPIAEALREAVAGGDEGMAFAHALDVLPSDDPGLRPELLKRAPKRVRELLQDPSSKLERTDDELFDKTLSVDDPDERDVRREVACGVLEMEQDIDREWAWRAMVEMEIECEAAHARMAEALCEATRKNWVCLLEPQADQQQACLADFAARVETLERADTPVFPYRSMLMWVRNRGSLPPAVEERFGPVHYDVHPPSGPPCELAKTDEPCQCAELDELLFQVACLDDDEKDGRREACAFTVDHGARRIEVRAKGVVTAPPAASASASASASSSASPAPSSVP